ncbi:Transcription factor VOZ1 [Dendrobium catenatum]|uniref:Transcription factor VOZ1 n=1 Tax=Dendrobium catenatum TaxID=906689 RepID=A0A2I0XJG1_9ASPA|nr:Transcription factor VOZ1 [Dendrobium catenatum]
MTSLEAREAVGGQGSGGNPNSIRREEYQKVEKALAGGNGLGRAGSSSPIKDLTELPQNDFLSADCQVAAAIDYPQFNMNQDMQNNQYIDLHACGQDAVTLLPHFQEMLPMICPPPAAFLRQKCALWDCPRPTQGSEWCQDYCSSFHATLAFNEGLSGMIPVVRPGGIDLKDGPLFASLTAKAQGKDVGIPQCEGAATTKSPWNAPEREGGVVKGEEIPLQKSEIFSYNLVEKETQIKPEMSFRFSDNGDGAWEENSSSGLERNSADRERIGRAFESGNRKQRSLPDYSGRGWHESRKQIMEEFGGLKRSYYMDPQPSNHFEWHLFEYEISNCDACALYRLEFKLADHKKSCRAKPNVDLLDLQQQMGKLSAEHFSDKKRHARHLFEYEISNCDACALYRLEFKLADHKKSCRAKPNVDLLDLQQQMGKLSAEHFSDKKRHAKGRAKANLDSSECTQKEIGEGAQNDSPIYGPHLPYAYSIDSLNNYYGSDLK